MVSYNFFKNFIKSSIALIHCVSFFNFFLIIENVRNNIKFLLKSYFNFIVSFLLFSIILLIFFQKFDICYVSQSFFSTSFLIFNVTFFSFFVVVMFAVIIFFTVFFFRFRFLLFSLLLLSRMRMFLL